MKPRPIYKTVAGEQAIMAAYDRILELWPDTAERLEIDTRHGRTFGLALGQRDAPPLVLFHGAGSNALTWIGDAQQFAAHFRVYAVDTPGEPGRSCHRRIPWDGDGIVEWVEDLLDKMDIGEALVAGISQGGYIGLRFATARPDRVKGLALLAPGGVTPVRPGFMARAVLYGMLGPRGTDALVRYTLGDCDLPQGAMDYMRLIFMHFRSRMDAQPLLGDDELRRLTMPVLLMAGSKDVVFDSSKTVARVGKLVEQADIRLLPVAGHALVNVAATLTPFLVEAAAGPDVPA